MVVITAMNTYPSLQMGKLSPLVIYSLPQIIHWGNGGVKIGGQVL